MNWRGQWREQNKKAPKCPHCGRYPDDLTPAELRTILAFCRLTDQNDVADELGIARRTVVSHMVSLRKRWGLTGRNQAAMIPEAIRRGVWIPEGYVKADLNVRTIAKENTAA